MSGGSQGGHAHARGYELLQNIGGLMLDFGKKQLTHGNKQSVVAFFVFCKA